MSEQIESSGEWNEKAGELVLTKRGEIPSDVRELETSLVTGDLIIENCVEGETPSYVVTAVVRASTEAKAREKYSNIGEAFDVRFGQGTFEVEEKSKGFSGDVQVSSRSIVMTNGEMISGGNFSGGGVTVEKKVVMRVGPEQASRFNLSSVSGNMYIQELGDGEIRSSPDFAN